MMLERTLDLIGDLKAGTYIDPADKVYDEAELLELGQILNRLLYAPSQVRAKLQELGVNIVPANFYSEVPSISEIEDSRSHLPIFDRIFDRAKMESWLEKLDRYADEFAPPVDPPSTGGFGWNNTQFSYSDAMSYYCVIREVKPARVIEIGSGWSSLVALMALRENGSGELICIDPFPAAVLDSIRSEITLIPCRAQDLDIDFISNNMKDGDILFIDSTHTVKHNSDCLHIYLRILPEITADIYVHVHDIRLPNALSVEMMRDSQIYWTEQYLLYAYLIDNIRCEVLFGLAYLNQVCPVQLSRFMRDRYTAGGVSLWFRQGATR